MISVDDLLGLNEDMYWENYHDSLNITGKDLPGFLVRFFWAPFLHYPDEKTKSKNQKLKSIIARRNLRQKEKKKRYNKFWSLAQSEYDSGLEKLKLISMVPPDQFPDIILLGK